MENWPRHRLTPRGSALANPVIIYAGTWLVILLLVWLHLTIILKPLSVEAVLLVAGSVAIAVVLGAFFWAVMPRLESPTAVEVADELAMLYRWRKIALIVWAIGTLIEIRVARGVPMLWLLQGETVKDYRNFGIPTMHGFLVALFFFATSVTALEIFLHGRARQWKWLGLMMVWPLILVNRGPLMWQLLELLGIFLICRRVRLRAWLGVGVIALTFVIAFGVLGDIRNGGRGATFTPIISPEALPVVGRLPSGFVWVYLYATTPINNVASGIGSFEPTGQFFFSIQALVPTVIREKLVTDPTLKFPLGLVNEAFNTSTWFVGWLADFGVAGALIGTSVLLAISIFFYRIARAWRPWAIIGFAACFQGIVLSAFADTFTSLVTVLQLMLASLAGIVVLAKRSTSGGAARE